MVPKGRVAAVRACPSAGESIRAACLVLWIPSKRMLVVGAVVSAAYALLVVNNLYLA